MLPRILVWLTSRRWSLTLVGLALGTVVVACTHAADCYIQKVYDGDTVQALCGKESSKVRLYCIDAPELAQQPWGPRSRAALRERLPRRVRLIAHERDRYGRIVGELFHGSDNINLALVRQGHAAVYPAYCSEPRFYRAEEQARQQKLGIWKTPGLHQKPWRFRARHR